jgi:ABC-type transport system involved in multi-copper enzyme maturation permease subunit
MSSPEVIYVCRCLIRDTFLQALANRVFWIMLGANAVVIFFCLSISIEGGESLRPTGDLSIDRPHGQVLLAFGAWRLELFRDGQAMVNYILLVLGEGAFGVVGTLLVLVMTAGFVPEFLQPSNATVLLSKPTPRWVLLLGKYLGVMTLLAVNVAVFVIGTWLALGLRTGFWVNSYLWGIPLLLLQVAAVYSFSAFLGVLTGSTLACVIGSVLFWFMCFGMNYGRHMVFALESELPRQHFLLRGLAEAGYWILPKPVDLGMMLHAAVEAGQTDKLLEKVVELGGFHPELAVLTSLAFIVGMVALAANQLASKDY